MPKKKNDIPKDIKDAIDGIAKGLGVAATEVWRIFVQQYLVRGIAEGFVAIVLVVASYMLYSEIGMWVLIPLSAAVLLFYGAIIFVGNPKYYALGDITKRIGQFQGQPEAKEVIAKLDTGRW